MEKLTDRELEALFWTANGRQPDEIATIMVISRKRVNNMLYDIRQSLQAHTTAHAVSIALQRGYLSLDEIYDPGNPPTKEQWFKNAARFMVFALLVVTAHIAVSTGADPIARNLRTRRREDVAEVITL